METGTVFVDIPIPDWNYQNESDSKILTVILPLSHPIAQLCSIEKPVRALIIYDEDYADLEGGVALSSIRPLAQEFYEFEYIRDCRLRNVVSAEWKICAGEINLESYLATEPMIGDEKVHLDTPMRVLCLRKPYTGLKELNRRYGTNKINAK